MKKLPFRVDGTTHAILGYVVEGDGAWSGARISRTSGVDSAAAYLRLLDFNGLIERLHEVPAEGKGGHPSPVWRATPAGHRALVEADRAAGLCS